MNAAELRPGDYITRASWAKKSVVIVTSIVGSIVHGTFNGQNATYVGDGWLLLERPAQKEPEAPVAEPEAPATEVKPKPVPKKRPKGAQEYKGNGKHYWQKVNGETKRLRVPGGWLYDTGTAAVFVPIPEVVGYAV
jgi:hypothetical protein